MELEYKRTTNNRIWIFREKTEAKDSPSLGPEVRSLNGAILTILALAVFWGNQKLDQGIWPKISSSLLKQNKLTNQTKNLMWLLEGKLLKKRDVKSF